jgi:hypothetical protein
VTPSEPVTPPAPVTPPVVAFVNPFTSIDNYTFSNTCQRQDPSTTANADPSVVCCNNPGVGAAGTAFCARFPDLAGMYTNFADPLCTVYSQVQTNCTATDPSVYGACGSSALYSYAIVNSIEPLYAMFQNDATFLNNHVSYCVSKFPTTANYTVSDIQPFYNFDFGNIGGP